MTQGEVGQFNQALKNDYSAELLANGLVRVFDRGSKLAGVYDGETGAGRFGDLTYSHHDLNSYLLAGGR